MPKSLFDDMIDDLNDFQFDAPSSIHLPIVLAIDMGAKARCSNDNYVEMIENFVNGLVNCKLLTDYYYYGKHIDIMIMSYSDEVIIEQNWISLSRFKGNITVSSNWKPAQVYTAIIQAINSSRKIRIAYKLNGIRHCIPQIFMLTSGMLNESDNKITNECLNLFEENIKNKRINLNMILLPKSDYTCLYAQYAPYTKLFRIYDCIQDFSVLQEFVESYIYVNCIENQIGDKVRLFDFSQKGISLLDVLNDPFRENDIWN